MCTFLSVSLIPELAEQHAKDQQDTAAITDDTSDFDSKIIDAAEEAAQSKDSVALYLVDDTKEVVIEESTPEEEILNVIIEEEGDAEGRDESEKSTTAATILG